MRENIPLGFHVTRIALAALAVFSVLAETLPAQPLIPGTGYRIKGGGDDFEDPDWEFTHNFPKSSRNLDKREREPFGMSKNERWFESPKRGQPDVLRRVAPPAGGIEGSTGALLMRTLHSGLPGAVTRTSQQDDLLFDVGGATNGATIPVSQSPSVVVRVYLPPFDEWEDHTGTSFGFRVAMMSSAWRRKSGLLFTTRVKKREIYFPGIFIQFNSKTDSGREKDSAVFIIRGDDYGKDFLAGEITQTGWWTLGISFTPDGRAHYYASPGVDDLTGQDHIASHFPQSVHCERLHTYFFNVCNTKEGATWSTTWIIDDPALYVRGR